MNILQKILLIVDDFLYDHFTGLYSLFSMRNVPLWFRAANWVSGDRYRQLLIEAIDMRSDVKTVLNYADSSLGDEDYKAVLVRLRARIAVLRVDEKYISEELKKYNKG